MHNRPPELRTSGTELLGSTTSMVLTAVVAFVGLVGWLGAVFWTDAQQGGKRVKVGWRRTHGVSSTGEISPGQGERPWERIEDRHVPQGGHPHGRPASWVVVIMLLAAFAVGGVSIIAHAWWLFWTCAGMVLLCIPAGKAVGITNDTISWGSTETAGRPSETKPGPRPILPPSGPSPGGRWPTPGVWRLPRGRPLPVGARSAT